jgi:protoporphyrinogen oxidase
MDNAKIIAVDFDGTLVENKWPEIGAPIEKNIAKVKARIRLGDKFSRFKTLSRLSCNDRDQQQVTDESIRDTLLDLANYAIMTVLEMDAPDESHATMYAYDKPFYTVGEDK